MKLIGHLKTITKHRHMVMRLCFRVGIGAQGLKHDLSKYSPTELKTGAKYYVGTRSPNSIEREEKGYSEAWLHHKGRNKHHFEYWYDYSAKEKKYVPVPMPERYLLESFCDRIAASKVYKGKTYTDSAPLEYFVTKNDGALMHPASAKTLLRWLTVLAEKGEKTRSKKSKPSIKNIKRTLALKRRAKRKQNDKVKPQP